MTYSASGEGHIIFPASEVGHIQGAGCNIFRERGRTYLGSEVGHIQGTG